ncbi:MAG: winged helix-turn-helix domain-containing protein [Armatimonadia bacterium]
MNTDNSLVPGRQVHTAHDIVREPEYAFLILQALVKAGGTSTPMSVREDIYPHVADRLSDWDRNPVSDKPKSRPRWAHRMECVRFKLCRAGLMQRDSRPGVWEITEEGRSHLVAGDLEATWKKLSTAFSAHRNGR